MEEKGGIVVARVPFLEHIKNVLHRSNKHVAKITVATIPLIYVGNWVFTDEENGRQHHLEISADLTISLDRRQLAGKVISIDNKELVFLDNYGYQLRIDAVDNHPISVYDEADNRVYQLGDSPLA
ncbi:DUF4828 domain-containing protein [Ligilactobacillus equi]|uniref:DUF4828 domain-containing protein n=2 Tax=Ligilactobacillus equi TaxID=137357 RepID=V7HWG4_9LACO|nr:DUF4828 domain-containing protein [Ligilactobacillus equi]ETA73620.1 hypothetical protein LEQ_0879 [Ligilactobacillus equi DPC 6820]KRL85321.1 hypothetical protein FC36_GL000693 [Ligilactobacillus equi DSM 15833 = JCM 10991]MCQ2557306.1 DUF4828 domain-containing protein [Ligilactobacillus sp.]